MLDLLNRPDYLQAMNEVIAPSAAEVGVMDKHHPKGHADPEEWTIRRFAQSYLSDVFDCQQLADWWVDEQFKNPTWDMLSTCTLHGHKAVLMVEAKAHENELDPSGKSLLPGASGQSVRNHERILRCLKQAESGLNEVMPGFRLCNSHYQLCNRIATAWKLASCGIHVVLLYLGFLGDNGIGDVGVPFKTDEQWQDAMRAYARGVLPEEFSGAPLQVGSGTLRFIVGSLTIQEPSVLRSQFARLEGPLGLERLRTVRKSGDEKFSDGASPLGFTVLDFWRWSSSDLLGNTARGRLAEYIVARAIGLGVDDVQNEWEPFDLQTDSGVRVEVKSAAYVQSWHQRKLSSPTFGCAPRRVGSADTGSLGTEEQRHADVYVFALLAHQDKASVNPLDLAQWQFYVVPTELLRRSGVRKCISLKSLQQLCPVPSNFKGLRHAIDTALAKADAIKLSVKTSV